MSARETPLAELLEIIDDFRSFVDGSPRTSTSKKISAIPLQEPGEPEQLLDQLIQQVETCTKCEISKERMTTIFSDGPSNAQLMLIGEAPSAEDAQNNTLFSGEVGQLLSKMFQSIDFPRESLYITNIIKCALNQKRKPSQDEITNCSSFLHNQIKSIQPRMICTLGSCATQAILNTEEPISNLRGKIHYYNNIPVIPIFHPAYLLHSPSHKKQTWADLKLLRRTFDELS